MYVLVLQRKFGTVLIGTALALGACSGDRAGEMADSIGIDAASGEEGTSEGTGSGAVGEDTTGGTSGTDADAADEGDPGGPNSPLKFDFGIPDAPEGSVCGAPSAVTCDPMSNDPWHAIGLNCPGGPQVNGSINLTNAAQLHVHTGNVGTYVDPVDGPPFPPREGEKIVILSSGVASELLNPNVFASTPHNSSAVTLPAPIQINTVSATEDCIDNPGLVGTGDCSNTIQGQYTQGGGPRDYGEMRFSVEVPVGTFGFSYDFAFFSVEYPGFYKTQYNDMYIAWLESEQWTGNISFDEQGNPISLNAGFLDYKDASNPHDCPAPCQAPELQGTALEGHAGTKWLSTQAPVTPGETITVIFGIFDLSDAVLDSMVILDNFEWNCEGGPPLTIPG